MGYLTTRWLHEAPEDGEQEAPANAAEGEAPAEGEAEGGEDQEQQEEPPEENFDIDTSLNDDDEGGEDAGGDEGGVDDLEAPPEDAGGSEGGDRAETPNPSNTSIFNTLTAEEQEIKIGELKKLYKDLYSGINDLIHRIDNMDLDEDILEVMSTVSEVLYRLQDSVADYFQNLFNIRSYFENDVKYNEFLLVLKKTTSIVDDLADSREKRSGENPTNSQDKNDNI